mgnify:FL=1
MDDSRCRRHGDRRLRVRDDPQSTMGRQLDVPDSSSMVRARVHHHRLRKDGQDEELQHVPYAQLNDEITKTHEFLNL